MPLELVVVDAFTDKPFSGNQAAIGLLDGPADDDWMQRVAAEMNLSETAFLWPLADGSRSLRWFTPTVEVDLCGHATLASAHVLFGEGHCDRAGLLRFSTRSGELTARLNDDRVELEFPRHSWELTDDVDLLAAAAGVGAAAVSATAIGGHFHLVELDHAGLVAGLHPDIAAIAALPEGNLLVTAAGAGGEDGPDTVSRYFAPRFGIDEDPVTGSAHCLVGPWFSERLGTVLRCHQASARGGDLLVTVDDDRVRLAGDAVTTLRTTVLV